MSAIGSSLPLCQSQIYNRPLIEIDSNIEVGKDGIQVDGSCTVFAVLIVKQRRQRGKQRVSRIFHIFYVSRQTHTFHVFDGYLGGISSPASFCYSFFLSFPCRLRCRVVNAQRVAAAAAQQVAGQLTSLPEFFNGLTLQV